MDITDFIKATGNEYAGIASEGVMAGDVASWLDTGSYALNALISGSIFKGLPSNRITAVGSHEGAGKSFLALSLVKNFLQENPDGLALIFETEGALTKDTLNERGIDLKRVGIVPVVTVQEFKTQCLKIIDNYEKEEKEKRKPLMFVLDSLGMLSTNKEMEDSSAGKDTRDMTRAQLLKATFRVLTLRLGKVNVPLFVTNHIYDAVGEGPYAQPVLSGGSGLKYSASTILSLSKAKDKENDGTQRGVIVTITARKSRLTKENTKIKARILFRSGLDRYYWLPELAIEAGIFKKVSTRIELPDGSKTFVSSINKDPEKYFTQEILEQLDAWIKKEFMYG